MSYKERIESNYEVMLGKPVIKGTRITVELILKKLAGGFTVDEILSSYDQITKEDIYAAIEYAAYVVSEEETVEPVK
ncbi:MAG TPA: DUF433 domain-containing protein [Ignavibacteria bacterium]|nr:DUF433 domain-containing protein [Ignavibacteria bacterium]HMQ97605.1 DUF433 domain-containing protein [Ignavibacteria bacterium]